MKIDLQNSPPSLYDIIANISNHGGDIRSQRQSIGDVQLAAQTVIFMEKYDLDTLEDMGAAVKELRSKYAEIKADSSKYLRRYAVLQEHIKHGENYGKHLAVYTKWRKMKEGTQFDKFFQAHKDEIAAFREAHNYLTLHLNGCTEIPLVAWKREFADVSNRHAVALAETDKLAAEIKSSEAIMRNAERVMGVEQTARKRGHEVAL
jgi:hypothetical protein